MKRSLGFGSFLAHSMKIARNDDLDVDATLAKLYAVFKPVLTKAFRPIRQALLNDAFPIETYQGWVLLCQRLSQGGGFDDIGYWKRWDEFLGGNDNKNCRILSDFKYRNYSDIARYGGN